MRLIRGGVSVFIALFLLFAPGYLGSRPEYRPYRDLFQAEEPDWYGVIELWHIVSGKPYQGSVTDHLTRRARAFNDLHQGVHIKVSGMSEQAFSERMARGETPDGFSFQGGLLYKEQLTPLSLPAVEYAGKLQNASADGTGYAAPWYYSGYALAVNTQRLYEAGLSMPETADAAFLQQLLGEGVKKGGVTAPEVIAAQLDLTGELGTREEFLAGKLTAGIVDLAALGALHRGAKANVIVESLPYGAYTDQVQYLGVSRRTDEKRAALLSEFFAALQTPEEQRRLAALGLMPACANVPDAVYGEEILTAYYEGSQSVAAPEALLYQRHKDALLEDAKRALRGEAGGREAFFERFDVVLGEKS